MHLFAYICDLIFYICAYAVCNTFFKLYYASLLAHDITLLHSVIENKCFFLVLLPHFSQSKVVQNRWNLLRSFITIDIQLGTMHYGIQYGVLVVALCAFYSRSSKYSMPREIVRTVKRPQKWSINIPVCLSLSPAPSPSDCCSLLLHSFDGTAVWFQISLVARFQNTAL